jgi:uncharacterized protein (TIGR03067 family)
MNLLSLALVAFTLFTGQATPAQTPAAAPALSKEAAALLGRWVVTLLNDQDPQGALELQFEGNKYAVAGAGADENGTFKLDATKTPWTFDLTIVEGTDAGKVQLGILEMKGDAIHGLLAIAGGPTRPANFDSADGAIAFVAVKKK